MILPYKIKVVEKINLIPRRERIDVIKKAGFNPFLIPAKKVYIDLVSDSGTTALSSEQLSQLMLGDESFAFQEGYFLLKKKVEEIFGFKYFIPFHQGRAIESAISEALLKGGEIVPSNSLFETTRANIEIVRGEGVDLPSGKGIFGGNIDIERLEKILKTKKNVPFILLTITNNSVYGFPVSLENMEDCKTLSKKYKIPIILDASRFAENCYFIWKKERKRRSFKDVVKEVFSIPETAYISCKKDCLSNIGGIFMTRSKKVYEKVSEIVTVKEGFISHGGLNDRDMRVILRGIEEVIDEQYIEHRIEQVKNFHNKLKKLGIPVIEPASGHAVYIDVGKIFKKSKYPGYLASALVYIEGGIRGGVFGGVLSMGKVPETMRLSIPRRVYTEEHLSYTAGKVKIGLSETKWDLEPLYIPEKLKIFGVRFRKKG